jgi:hypothetical protein
MGNNYIIEINAGRQRFYYGEIFGKSDPEPRVELPGSMVFRNLEKITYIHNIEEKQPLDPTDFAYIKFNRMRNDYEIEYIEGLTKLYSLFSRENIGLGKKHKSKKMKKSKSNKMRKIKRKTRKY